MRLTVELLRACAGESKNQNMLISPLSIQLALAMVANGADGMPRKEMENLLGGEISMPMLNEYLAAYVRHLSSEEKCKLIVANSLWLRDADNRLQVEQSFLQTNADFYGAQIHKAPFDDGTVKNINRWVAQHTEGMIDKIVERIDADTVAYLLNALVLDAQWETVYSADAVGKGDFTNILGQRHEVDMLHSVESLYLDDGQATGFMKSYSGGAYSFAALMPNEGVDICEYISGISHTALLDTLRGAKSGTVIAAMPKFSCTYELSMNGVLQQLGMHAAFSDKEADFSKLAHSSDGNIFIGNVLHKSFICVDELGTKAGAVTKVEMDNKMSLDKADWVVTLDRPFVYMIIDNATNLPVFIGTLMDV